MRRTEQLSRSLVLVAAALLAAGGIAAMVAIVAVVPSSEETSARDHASLDLSSASAEVRQAYQLALARRDLFAHLPCYCGCVLLDEPHRSLADCFVRADGSFDTHASGCRICVDIALDAEAASQRGLDHAAIRALIDEKYAKSGPGTSTPLPDN